MKFDGSSWQTVGPAGFSAGGAGEISIALDSSDIPYVAYADLGNFGKATVMKFAPDTTPPVLTVPADVTLQATGPDGAVHTFTASATDDTDPNPTVSCSPPSGSTFPLGTTTVTCTATDAAGNSSSASFKVTVEKPTAISLVSFTVEANDGRAMVMWETGTEIDNAGFNIYRSSSPDGPWFKVNDGLIAAEGDPVSGTSYTFVDTPGRGTFYYRLEDVDYFGLSTLYDPVLAELGAAIRAPWFRPVIPEF
jgi:hypothetical protein